MTAPWRDVEFALDTIIELANSGPDVSPSERFSDLESLQAFVAERRVSEVDDLTEAELVEIRRIRSELRSVITAPDETRAELINALLMRADVRPRIAVHDGLRSHLHYFQRYASLSDHLLADLSMALAVLVVAGQSSRLKLCARPGCGRALLDTTRSHTRAFCSSALCGNRVHGAAHRARKKELQPHPADMRTEEAVP
jgi:predicted RNA-binding Zn ribbon-like protein